MPVIDKSTLFPVALESMNEIHHEEADMLNALDELMQQVEQGSAAVDSLEAKLDEFLDHMTSHFRGEEVEMEAINFPPYRIHKSEHDNELAKASECINNWKTSNDLEPLATYLREELPQWLDQHIATMDKVTAHFLAMNGREVSLSD